MGWLGVAGGYLAGLMSAFFFAWGFKAHKKVEDTGKFIGKPTEYEPVVNDSMEAQIERAQSAARNYSER